VRPPEHFDPLWKLLYMWEHPWHFPLATWTALSGWGDWLWLELIGIDLHRFVWTMKVPQPPRPPDERNYRVHTPDQVFHFDFVRGPSKYFPGRLAHGDRPVAVKDCGPSGIFFLGAGSALACASSSL